MSDANYEPSDRRPIAARETRWASRAAAWLVRRKVSANSISIIGLVAGVGAGVVFVTTASLVGIEQRLAWLLGALLVQLRLLANLLDGMVAIGSGKASRTGELYNDVPDRFSDVVGLIGLGHAANSQPELGYLAGCAALLTAYVRVLGKASGVGSDYSGPMAKQQRMFVVTVCAVYLALAPVDWQPAWGLPRLALTIIGLGALLTACRRLQRIAQQLRAKHE